MSLEPPTDADVAFELLERAMRDVGGCALEHQHHDNACAGRQRGACAPPCWVARARELLAKRAGD